MFFWIVFKALDRYRSDLPPAQQYVAIKILHATAANHEARLANLRREFYGAQALSHRNIVNVLELDKDGDVDFFTMEFLEGELLSRVMERLQPLPLCRPQAWAIIREIGSALEYAHACNVVHADLKPQNIMVTHSAENFCRAVTGGPSTSQKLLSRGEARLCVLRTAGRTDGRSARRHLRVRVPLVRIACRSAPLSAPAFNGGPRSWNSAESAARTEPTTMAGVYDWVVLASGRSVYCGARMAQQIESRADGGSAIAGCP
jgi:serine/threonine protein kinase